MSLSRGLWYSYCQNRAYLSAQLMMPTNFAAAIATLPILTVLLGLQLPASRTMPPAFAVTVAIALLV